MRAREFVLLEVSDKIKQQMAARWKAQDPNLTDDNIKYYLDRWDRFSPKFPVNQRDITRLSFADVEKLIDGAVASQELKGKAKPQTQRNNADAIYNQNNLEIYKGDMREKCILYGRGYTWCISRADSSNLFYSYRMRKESMFYFVFDLDRPKTDPWHAVVIYVDPKNTYHVATAPNTGDEQMSWEQISAKHPKLKNLQGLFKPQPLTTGEREDHAKYQKPVSLNTYQQFDLNEKYKYIMYGHQLDDEQQAVTPDQLIGTYAKNQVFSISKDTWYSRLRDGDRRKIEQTQIDLFYGDQNGGGHQFDGNPFLGIISAGIKPSDKVMMAALGNYQSVRSTMKYMLEVGMELTEEMMLTALKTDGSVIELIIKAGIEPTEEMMLIALKTDHLGDVIKDIVYAGIKPSDKVIMAALTEITSVWFAMTYMLENGIEPTEEMILTALKTDESVIELIIDAGIKPTEEMILTALKKSPEALRFLLKSDLDFKPTEEMMKAFVIDWEFGLADLFNSGIKPSEEVIMTAIKNYPSSLIALLKRGYKPSEELIVSVLKRNGRMIRSVIEAGIKPTEKMMLAAVANDRAVIKDLINAGIKPSEAVLNAQPPWRRPLAAARN